MPCRFSVPCFIVCMGCSSLSRLSKSAECSFTFGALNILLLRLPQIDSVFGRRFSHLALEELGKILDVDDAAVECYRLDLEVGAFQKMCGVCDPTLSDIFGYGFPGLLFEDR